MMSLLVAFSLDPEVENMGISKVIYIRLAIMIHLDGNVSSFALVSKQK